MKATPLSISDVLLIEPRVFDDDRGFFLERFNQAQFEGIMGGSTAFVQENYSPGAKVVLGGLHYQLSQPQDKLVRVVQDEIFDVARDIRRSSPTFGKGVGEVLSAGKKCPMRVPEGFVHGFLVIRKTSEFLYETTEYCAPQLERCIVWNDSALEVDWPIEKPPFLSGNDEHDQSVINAKVFA